MGYTHYWRVPADKLSDTARAEIASVCARICAAAADEGVDLCGPLGRGVPRCTTDEIALNGDETQELNHESFSVVLGHLDDDFCKTGRKPYDLAVTAILAYLSAYHGFDVSSDGDVADWEAGTALAGRVTGLPIPNPMIVEMLS